MAVFAQTQVALPQAAPWQVVFSIEPDTLLVAGSDVVEAATPRSHLFPRRPARCRSPAGAVRSKAERGLGKRLRRGEGRAAGGPEATASGRATWDGGTRHEQYKGQRQRPACCARRDCPP